ncbi:MAG: adenylate/guanylate cyclase domain-containing protein, partial [Hyphomicrobiaceae bacterium]
MGLAATISGYIAARFEAETLPDRVRALIRDREDISERLIGWVQLGLVLTFAALFFLAPRPVDAGMPMFEPVPIALVAYASFTMLRLLLAYRGRLPWAILVASILIDTVLLMTLIWSFHSQYGQPSAFSLKVPTFVYVFVFIVLRGLRFDYRYVLLTGISFAVGWLIVLAAAIKVDGVGAITRNFGHYLTSNRILIGAEFDKILAVLLVTALLAAAVRRAQAMLVLATREEAAGREIRRFLSGGVAEVIASSDQLIEAGTAVEREAAIVMLDIRGFTRLAAMVPPHRLVEILTGFHARIVPLIEAHNGVIDKFLGDGVMITFGAVRPSATASADALRALDAIIADAALWRAEVGGSGEGLSLDVNGAAASGPVVFATLGSARRLEFTVIGEAVNLAAKLEKHNKAEGSRA